MIKDLLHKTHLAVPQRKFMYSNLENIRSKSTVNVCMVTIVIHGSQTSFIIKKEKRQNPNITNIFLS